MSEPSLSRRWSFSTWYGMNFSHMNELESPHGYLYAVGLTLVGTLTMFLYLKKKKWF